MQKKIAVISDEKAFHYFMHDINYDDRSKFVRISNYDHVRGREFLAVFTLGSCSQIRNLPELEEIVESRVR